MKRHGRSLRAALTAVLFLCGCEHAAGKDTIVIHDVTVIDGTGRPPNTHVDLVLRDGRIASLEDARTYSHPTGAQVIDGQGKYVIPGLIDMHAHIAGDVLDERGEPGDRWDREVALPFLRTFLQFGVTTIRDPGAITAEAVLLRRLLAEGKAAGPQLFSAGRILNNSNFRPPGFAPVHDEADVREEIRWQALAGVDFIKIYSSMPPPLVSAAIEEAHRLGLPVIGHLQRTTWTEAARLGIDGLEHAAPWSAAYLEEDARAAMPDGMFARVYWLQHLDEARIDEMIALLAERQIVVDPTLMATMYTKFWADDPRWTQNPDLAYVPESLRKGWAAGGLTRDWTSAQFAEAKRSWPVLLGLIKTMHDRGGPLVAGTDTPTPWIVPGASLHDELRLLDEAGIPPLQVIRIATSNAARALRRQHEFGSIAPYAAAVVRQIRHLLAAGVPAANISVIGASKGAVIAMLVSTDLETPIRYVLLANCNAYILETFPVRLHGDVLSIYEATDELGQSCAPLFDRSPALGRRREVRLTTGLRHGFIFRPLAAWVQPAIEWARGSA